MSSYLFLIICSISIVFARIEREKPFKCPSDGHFGDPDDCTKFYRCAHGRATPEFCPASLFWNQGNLNKYFRYLISLLIYTSTRPWIFMSQFIFLTLDAFVGHILIYLSSHLLHRLSILLYYYYYFLIRPLTSEEGVYKISDTILWCQRRVSESPYIYTSVQTSSSHISSIKKRI